MTKKIIISRDEEEVVDNEVFPINLSQKSVIEFEESDEDEEGSAQLNSSSPMISPKFIIIMLNSKENEFE